MASTSDTSTGRVRSRNPGSLGALGERLALDHLTRMGFRLVTRNHRTRFGELDLIVSDGSTLVFVEVKSRRVGAADHPFEKLGPAKRRQVRRMAAAWLSDSGNRPSGDARPRHAAIRCDAIAVTIDRDNRLVAIEHLEAAF